MPTSLEEKPISTLCILYYDLLLKQFTFLWRLSIFWKQDCAGIRFNNITKHPCILQMNNCHICSNHLSWKRIINYILKTRKQLVWFFSLNIAPISLPNSMPDIDTDARRRNHMHMRCRMKINSVVVVIIVDECQISLKEFFQQINDWSPHCLFTGKSKRVKRKKTAFWRKRNFNIN